MWGACIHKINRKNKYWKSMKWASILSVYRVVRICFIGSNCHILHQETPKLHIRESGEKWRSVGINLHTPAVLSSNCTNGSGNRGGTGWTQANTGLIFCLAICVQWHRCSHQRYPNPWVSPQMLLEAQIPVKRPARNRRGETPGNSVRFAYGDSHSGL